MPISTSQRSVLSELLQRHGGSHTVSTVVDAYAWCNRLAVSHYENFPVASRLLPASMRQHITAVYAFARLADDIADEDWTSDSAERRDALLRMQQLIEMAVEQRIDRGHPIAVALSHSIADKALSSAPFLDLLEAFRQDIDFRQPSTWNEVIQYCSYSANPVGRLVLAIAGVHDPQALQASDDVCTALQLVNFWQDLSIDIPRGRQYLPYELQEQLGRSAALQEAILRTTSLFHRGRTVARIVPSMRLRVELHTIIRGGERMLERCQDLGDELWNIRPILRKADYFSIALNVAADLCRNEKSPAMA